MITTCSIFALPASLESLPASGDASAPTPPSPPPSRPDGLEEWEDELPHATETSATNVTGRELRIPCSTTSRQRRTVEPLGPRRVGATAHRWRLIRWARRGHRTRLTDPCVDTPAPAPIPRHAPRGALRGSAGLQCPGRGPRAA